MRDAAILDICVADFIQPEQIAIGDVSSREKAITSIISMIAKQGKLKDEKKFYQAIMQRESIVSTGIGMGIALPHAKLEEIDDFFIGVSIQTSRGLEWNSLDEMPVWMVFLIGGPINEQNTYLTILSQLTRILKDTKNREALTKCKHPLDVVKIFKGC